MKKAALTLFLFPIQLTPPLVLFVPPIAAPSPASSSVSTSRNPSCSTSFVTPRSDRSSTGPRLVVSYPSPTSAEGTASPLASSAPLSGSAPSRLSSHPRERKRSLAVPRAISPSSTSRILSQHLKAATLTSRRLSEASLKPSPRRRHTLFLSDGMRTTLTTPGKCPMYL